MQVQSNWNYAGAGSARANGSIRITNTNRIAKLGLNFDTGSTAGGDNGSTTFTSRVNAEIYGIR